MKNIIDLLTANARDFLVVGVTLFLALVAISVLADPLVQEDSLAGILITLLVGLVTSCLKFVVCCLLAWVALYWTFPEASKVVFSSRFDHWWHVQTTDTQMRVGLGAAAVLVIVAGICFV